ncbi:hypothetical protein [Psychrobacter sp.]|uniref:hypothetical protein n=1 Tax=Psychrobacter sp. TaxID=56811 RepID=UPI003566193C
MSLVDLIKKEDDEYISVSAFIELVSKHTKDSNDLVIEYLGKFCLSDRYEQVGFYTKNSGNGYTRRIYLSNLICKDDKKDCCRFYTMSELEKSDSFLVSYFLKDEIFNASFIESLNLKPDSDNSNLKFENIKDLIDSEFEKQHSEYISVNDFVNDLYKGIGSGKPLKFTLKSLLENTTLREVKLYRFQNLNYSLVSPTDNLKYKNTDDLLRNFYNVLDDEQTGTVTSDRKPFKDFYFNHSEIQDLVNSDFEFGMKQQHQIDEQSSTNNSNLLDNSSIITDLSENQRLLITYPSFTAEDIVCLIIDCDSARMSHYDEYVRAHRMVSKEIKDGSLSPNIMGHISAEQLKTWLANYGVFYKGFNDQLSDNKDKIGIAVVGHVKPKTYNQLVEELEAANNIIEDFKNKPAQVEAVKYSYTTPAMEIMDAVINEFWINYSPEQPAPKQSIITNWITQNFDISPALALNIDKVCRHSDARSGGQYKRS